MRSKVKLAFGGGVKLSDLPKLQDEDLDIVDMGRAILDAPLLDLRYDVQN
jgi:nicotinate-nucleotide pyrophosphorylase (carboxylating)